MEEFLKFLEDNWIEILFIFIILVMQVCYCCSFRKNSARILGFISDKLDIHFTDRILVESNESKEFKSVIASTNEYILASNDHIINLALCQKISGDKVEVLENSASALINIPLYLGLCGTFIGIITGLLELDLTKLFTESSSSELSTAVDNAKILADQTAPIRNLLLCVGTAMFASLCGLILMIWNTLTFRSRCKKCETNIEHYHKFLRLESAKQSAMDPSTLMRNMSQYQSELNATTHKVDEALRAFSDSVTKLDNIINYQTTTNHLIEEFRRTIERNFPNGSDARRQWRQAFDNLSSDAKIVADSLQSTLADISSYVSSFVGANRNVFESINGQTQVLNGISQYAGAQKTAYENLSIQITTLTTAVSSLASIEQGKDKDMIVALKAMTDALKEIKEKK